MTPSKQLCYRCRWQCTCPSIACQSPRLLLSGSYIIQLGRPFYNLPKKGSTSCFDPRGRLLPHDLFLPLRLLFNLGISISFCFLHCAGSIPSLRHVVNASADTFGATLTHVLRGLMRMLSTSFPLFPTIFFAASRNSSPLSKELL